MNPSVIEKFKNGPQYDDQEIYNFILKQYMGCEDNFVWLYYDWTGNKYIINLLIKNNWKIIYSPDKNSFLGQNSI